MASYCIFFHKGTPKIEIFLKLAVNSLVTALEWASETKEKANWQK